MPTIRLYQVDAFTSCAFSGNPAGVVPDARGLSEAMMRSIARELNNSETAFILPATDDTHDLRLRFFTPTVEVPSCGHATIAAHWVRGLEGAADGVVRQLSGAGILPIELANNPGGERRVWMTQLNASFGRRLSGELARMTAHALGADFGAVLDTLPIQIVSTGHSKVLVPFRNVRTLQSLSPNLAALEELSARLGCNGFYPFVYTGCPQHPTANARMFAPAIGIAEDPVTGNGAGPLGAYLAHFGQVRTAENVPVTMLVHQGEAMGRPGTVEVEVTRTGDGSIKVRISGGAALVFKTSITVSR